MFPLSGGLGGAKSKPEQRTEHAEEFSQQGQMLLCGPKHTTYISCCLGFWSLHPHILSFSCLTHIGTFWKRERILKEILLYGWSQSALLKSNVYMTP